VLLEGGLVTVIIKRLGLGSNRITVTIFKDIKLN
jgi:hypothetical protein